MTSLVRKIYGTPPKGIYGLGLLVLPVAALMSGRWEFLAAAALLAVWSLGCPVVLANEAKR